MGAAIGVAIGLVGGAACGLHAEQFPTGATIAAANEAGVSAWDLEGAVNTTGLEPREFLCRADGLLCTPPVGLRSYAYQTHPDVAWCIERIVQVESHGWFASGWNPVSVGRFAEHASGLGGFLPSTWASTPQGKAGRSIWDGYAQLDAISWMLHVGRGKEFAAVAMGRCG
jgi:hypothetical protein